MNERASNLTAIKRVEALERHMIAHGESINSFLAVTKGLDTRLLNLEVLSQARLVAEAREDERDKATTEWRARMEKDLSAIKTIGAKAVGIVFTALILAFVAWLVNGGMKL